MRLRPNSMRRAGLSGSVRPRADNFSTEQKKTCYHLCGGAEIVVVIKVSLIALALLAVVVQGAAQKAPNTRGGGPSVKALRREISISGRKRTNASEGTNSLDALLYFVEPRAYPYDRMDWSAYPAAVQHTLQMESAPMAEDITWSYVGPFGLKTAARQYRGEVRVSGRINGIAASRRDPKKLAIATSGAGVYETTDGGKNWASLSDRSLEWYFPNTTAIAYDPQDENMLYVGIGDYHGANSSTRSNLYMPDDIAGRAYPYGLLRYEANIRRWEQIGRFTGIGMYGVEYFDNQIVSHILVDPDRPNIITVSTGRGPVQSGSTAARMMKVWRTEDYGSNWSAVLSVQIPDDFGGPAGWSNVIIAPKPRGATDKVMYTIAEGNTEPYLYKSLDRGATWTKLQFKDDQGRDLFGVSKLRGVDVAASPAYPGTIYVIAGWKHAGNDWRGMILRSNNSGTTWKEIQAGFPNAGDAWKQVYYDCYLSCSSSGPILPRKKEGEPQDVKDVLYVGLIDLVASTDARANNPTWKTVGKIYDAGALTHADQQCATPSPQDPTTIFAGNDGGIYNFHYDAPNDRFDLIGSLNDRIRATEFYHCAFHPTDEALMVGGTQDNDCPAVILDADGRATIKSWANIFSPGDGGYCAIVPETPDTQYASGNQREANGSFYIPISKTTTDWRDLPGEDVRLAQPDMPNMFIATMAPNPLDSKVYVATNRLFYHDSAQTWKEVEPKTKFSSERYVLAIATSLKDSQRLYLGTLEGRIFIRRKMPGTNDYKWFRVDDELATGSDPMPKRSVSKIVVDRFNPDKFYFSVSGVGTKHFFAATIQDARDKPKLKIETRDKGSGSFQGLPDIPLNAIALDPADSQNIIWAGTDIGIYVTFNAGIDWNWVRPEEGIPRLRISELAGIPGNGFVFAATYGKGIYQRDRLVSEEVYNGDYSDRRVPTFNRVPPDPQGGDYLNDMRSALVFDSLYSRGLCAGFFANHFFKDDKLPERAYYELRVKVHERDGGELLDSGVLPVRCTPTGREFTLARLKEYRMEAPLKKYLQLGLGQSTYWLCLVPILADGPSLLSQTANRGDSFYYHGIDRWKSLKQHYSMGFLKARR